MTGHGKGEVDHVGGTAKVAVRQEIAAGKVLLDCDNILDFLVNLSQVSKRMYSMKSQSKNLIKKVLRLTNTNIIQYLNY